QGAAGSFVTDHEFTAATTRAGYPYMAGGVSIDERQLMAELGNNFKPQADLCRGVGHLFG
ncbi:MAG TPA: hypothetical protein VF089_20250, partial [Candidatus Binatia bacterium]